MEKQNFWPWVQEKSVQGQNIQDGHRFHQKVHFSHVFAILLTFFLVLLSKHLVLWSVKPFLVLILISH